jgi:hypothetical protein
VTERESGLYDPDDWWGYWQSLHAAPGLVGPLLALVERSLAAGEGTGTETVAWEEADGRHMKAEISYAVEEYRGEGRAGRVFHVLSIRSEGDPPPPFANV